MAYDVRKGVGKALGFAKAVGQGYMDNAREHKRFNQIAEKEVRATPSGSREHDVQRMAKRMRVLEKTEGTSLIGHIKRRLKK